MQWLDMAGEMRTQPSTPYGAIRSGVVLPYESFGDWALRNGMPYTLQLATPLFFTYGYSDVGLVPAGEGAGTRWVRSRGACTRGQPGLRPG